MILHALGEYELSLRFIEHALKLNLKYFGNKAMHVAVSYHLMARIQSCMGDFRSALNNEKETYSIYKSQVCVIEQPIGSSISIILLHAYSWARSTKRRVSRQSACVC